jgi:hypothetical protein
MVSVCCCNLHVCLAWCRAAPRHSLQCIVSDGCDPAIKLLATNFCFLTDLPWMHLATLVREPRPARSVYCRNSEIAATLNQHLAQTRKLSWKRLMASFLLCMPSGDRTGEATIFPESVFREANMLPPPKQICYPRPKRYKQCVSGRPEMLCLSFTYLSLSLSFE